MVISVSPDRPDLSSRRLIGLLGGTFDPVHHGHLRLALELWSVLPFAHIRLIPSAHPPHRPAPQASSAQRLALLKMAIAPLLTEAATQQTPPPLLIDERELYREGPSYTIDTLISLRAELGAAVPLAVIVGWDAFASLPSWHCWPDLLDQAHWVVGCRPGVDQTLPVIMQRCLQQRQVTQPQQLLQQAGGGIWIEEIPLLAISASQIRQSIQQGRSVRYLVPDALLPFLAEYYGAKD